MRFTLDGCLQIILTMEGRVGRVGSGVRRLEKRWRGSQPVGRVPCKQAGGDVY